MRILVLGSGGREHAVAWKLSQSPEAEIVFVAPGNGGTHHNVPLDPMDFPRVRQFCRETRIDLLVVGPEAPLVAGIADSFHGSGIPVFGPSARGARLEGSKIEAKRFMHRHGVATAEFWAFENDENPEQIFAALRGDLVVKYDGLAAGKGVYVCDSVADARRQVGLLKASFGATAPFLIERRLRGRELSIIGVTDGACLRLLLPSQDHKPIYEGDRGPNTGGMGAYAPVPFCDEPILSAIWADIVRPTLEGLQHDGIDYRGALYFGLMLTDEGPRLLEYNVRLGDPEAEVILPALESDFLHLIRGCVNGTLNEAPLAFGPGYHVDVVVASQGYPGPHATGFEIGGLDEVSPHTVVFHAGTRRDGEKVITCGGRVLNVVARGATLPDAIDRAYADVALITFENAYVRRDIGRKGVQ